MYMLGKQLTAKPHGHPWLHGFSSVLASDYGLTTVHCIYVLKYHSVPYTIYNHYVLAENKI